MDKKWSSPKEYLMQVKDLDNLIQTNLESITELKSSMLSIGNELKPDKVQSSNSYDFTDIIAKICDMEDTTNSYIDSLVELRNKIGNEIRALDNNLHVIILTNHYILGNSLVDISDKYNYGRSYVKHAHGWALEAFKEKYLEKFNLK